MIPITINKKKYQIKNQWSEITVEQAGEIMKLVVPETLLTLYQASDNKEITQALKKYKPELYRSFMVNVLAILSNVPRKILLTVSNLTSIYNAGVEHIPVDLIRFEPYSFTPLGITEFEHLGKYYHLPTVETLLNDEKPFADVNVQQALEALELNSHQADLGGDGLAGLVGILAREQGKEFSDFTAIQQSKIFTSLPMSVFWEVFFCSKALSDGVLALTTTYLNRAREGAEK